jgi:ADP-ribose pyrophosphatase
MEKWISSQIVYEGNIFSVREGEIETDRGDVYRRQVVINPGGVGVVSVLDDHIPLVKQFRISIGKKIIEIPSGRREENESPESCARRELMEEVGYIADKVELISEYYTAVGFSTEKMYIYLAVEPRKSHAMPEVDEDLEIIHLSLADVRDMLDRGEFEDSKTIIGLREALRRLDSK